VKTASTQRPCIGVTGPDRRFSPGWWFTARALRRAGAQPVRLVPGDDLPPGLSGIVIGGGDDISPERYHASPFPGGTFDPARDAFELQALDHCLPRAVPVLGICRGMQLLNVACGGDLHQDVAGRRRGGGAGWTPGPCRAIAVAPRSRLARILACRRCRVNSLHHQAVRRIGEGLRRSAIDADGIVQAIEGHGFLLGLQWHPEYLGYVPRQRQPFAALVAAARAFAGTRPHR